MWRGPVFLLFLRLKQVVAWGHFSGIAATGFVGKIKSVHSIEA
jgi:hypothetical protein